MKKMVKIKVTYGTKINKLKEELAKNGIKYQSYDLFVSSTVNSTQIHSIIHQKSEE